MNEVLSIIEKFRQPCSCGRSHETAVQDVRIGSGLVHCVGRILKENDFSRHLLLVADRNTLAAADGIADSLRDFDVEYFVYPELRVAETVESSCGVV